MLKTILKYIGAALVILVIVIFVASKTTSTVIVEHSFDASMEKVWSHWTPQNQLNNGGAQRVTQHLL